MEKNMKEKKYIVEMTDDELKRFKKLLKENKESKDKKKVDEALLTTMARFQVYKILTFHAAKTWAWGAKWSLCISEDMFKTYTEDYDFYIIQCGDSSGFGILTNKGTFDVREIRNKRMERLSVDELLEQFNDEGGEQKFTMDGILKMAHPKN